MSPSFASFKVEAIKTIKQAIKTAQKGGDVQAQIFQAIAQVQAGIDKPSSIQP